MRIEHSILACLSILAVGCNSGGPNSRPSTAQPHAHEQESKAANEYSPVDVLNSSATATPSKVDDSPSRYGWYETMRDDGIHFFTVQLTIPGFSQDTTREIAIQRLDRGERQGDSELLVLLDPDKCSPRRNVYTDGRNMKGGFGLGGGMHLVDDQSDDSSIMLEVQYEWTTPDQMRGNLNRCIPMKINIPVDIRFSNGCRLRIHWRPKP